MYWLQIYKILSDYLGRKGVLIANFLLNFIPQKNGYSRKKINRKTRFCLFNSKQLKIFITKEN